MSSGKIEFTEEQKQELFRLYREQVRNKFAHKDQIQSTNPRYIYLTFLFVIRNLEAVMAHSAYRRSIAAQSEPPAMAETILLLLAKKKYRDSLSVTLAEEFERRLQNGCSLKRARRLYWTSVLSSLGPQGKEFIRRHGYKALRFLGVVGFIEEVVRRFSH